MEKTCEKTEKKTQDKPTEQPMDRVVKVEELRKCLMNVGRNQDTAEEKVHSPVKK